jgi:hypothetical protein
MDNKGIFSSFTPPGANNNKNTGSEMSITEKIMYGIVMIFWGLLVGGISWVFLNVALGDTWAFLVGAIIGPIASHIGMIIQDKRMNDATERYNNLSNEEQMDFEINALRGRLLSYQKSRELAIETGNYKHQIEAEHGIAQTESELRQKGA